MSALPSLAVREEMHRMEEALHEIIKPYLDIKLTPEVFIPLKANLEELIVPFVARGLQSREEDVLRDIVITPGENLDKVSITFNGQTADNIQAMSNFMQALAESDLMLAWEAFDPMI